MKNIKKRPRRLEDGFSLEVLQHDQAVFTRLKHCKDMQQISFCLSVVSVFLPSVFP